MSDIVLVGSSPKLLSQSLGSTIDTFEHVVRFNAYETRGFEKHVGTKEKIWAVNLGLAMHGPTVARYMSGTDSRYIWYVGNNYDVELRMLKLKRTLKKQFVIESLNFDVAEYVESLANEFKEEKLCFKRNKIRLGPEEKYATTGLRAIFKALEKFGTATICGFSCWAECVDGVKNAHYYTIDRVPKHMHDAFTEHPDREHDISTESKIIDKLLKMRLLIELS